MGGKRFDPFSIVLGLGQFIGLVLIISSLCAGVRAQVASPSSGSEPPNWSALSIGFEELLVPTTATSSEEDAALSRAIASYRERATPR
jgi:hypothetical protein